MKLFLSVVLIGALINASTAAWPTNIFGNALKDVTGTVGNLVGGITDIAGNLVNDISGITKGVTSDTAHAGCLVFANTVKEYPIKAPSIEDVSFQLRTTCGSKELPVTETAKFRNASEFDVNKKTVVFVTGWLVETDKDYVADMAKAYHCRGGYNFVIVNTGGIITNLYVNSAYHTGKLGEFVAVGLQNLGIPVENIHLIGHSLGAQIVGSAARHYHKLTGRKLVRVTGLDPARPCFIEPIVFPRLGRGDADFVDIIHSNPKDLGTEEQVGDVDFYAGGLEVIKPGCSGLSLLCSHEISIQYYVESVYPNNEHNFMGVHCASYSDLEGESCAGATHPMGYATDVSARGIHYLTVRNISPYGMNAPTGATLPSGECGRCPN